MKATLAAAILKRKSLGITMSLSYSHQNDTIDSEVYDDFKRVVRYSEVLPKQGLIKKRVSITSKHMSPVTMDEYYNLEGHYVGDYAIAKMLMDRGIEPQLANVTDKVCSIGFCQAESKWYGWSHRAIGSFGMGSEVKFGDLAYMPSTVDMYCKSRELFYSDLNYKDLTVTPESSDSIRIKYTAGDLNYDGVEPVSLGRGEWVATSLEDARTMASNYAMSVSCCEILTTGNSFDEARSNFNLGLEHALNTYFNPTDSALQRVVRNSPYSEEVSTHILQGTNTNELSNKQALTMLLSESAARVLKDSDLDVGNFAWYEFTSSRTLEYDHHSKNLELSVEKGEFFGICYDAKRNLYLVTTLDSFFKGAPKLVTFQMSKQVVTRLIRSGRVPRVHKIEGIPIVKGNGDPDQAYHGNTQYDFKGTNLPTGKEDLDKEDIQNVKAPTEESKIGYIAYFVSDVFKRDLRVLASDDVDELKERLERAMLRAQNLASPGVIVATAKKSNIYRKVIAERGKAKTMQVAHTKSIMGSSIQVIDTAFAPAKADIKTGGSELRPTRKDLPKRVEPITKSNSFEVLKELAGFIGDDQFFTNAFVKLDKEPRLHKGHNIVRLKANLSDPLHEVEADSLIRRVESYYLVSINGKRYKAIRGVRSTGYKYDPFAVVVVFYVKIPKPWQGTHASIANRLSELEKAGKLDRTIRYTTKIIGEPEPVQVDLVKVDIERASVEVRTIRSGERMEVTNLWGIKGKERIL